MITRLAIHRFRGIREGMLDDINKVNLFIGPNNSGKTAILEMLYLAGVCGRECSVLIPDIEPSAWAAYTLNRHDFLGEEPLPRLRVRHGRPRKWSESPAVLTDEYNLDVEPEQLPKNYPMRRFTLSAPPEEGGRKRVFSRKDESDLSLFRIAPQTGIGIPRPMMPPFFDNQKVSLEAAHWTYLWEEPWVYRWKREELIDHFAVWAIGGEMPSPEHVLFFDFHTANGHFEKRFTQEARKIPDWYEKIAERLSRVFPEIRGAKVEIDDAPGTTQKKTGQIRFPGRPPIDIDHFGDGARHAFKVLAALIALTERVTGEQPGLFLWEDPELFMHPATLNRLLIEMLDLVKGKPIQVFLTSQSIELTALLTLGVERGELTEDLRVFRMGLRDGNLLAATFKYENIRSWLEGGMDPRFWIPEDIPFRYTFTSSEEGEA